MIIYRNKLLFFCLDENQFDKPNHFNFIDNPNAKKFNLSQNFPNPFNPVTTIKFGIVSSSSVSLKIYNSLGKEVHNLLEYNLTPGIYEIKWNAENFSSGIYFYKIEAQDFMEIKKMILVK